LKKRRKAERGRPRKRKEAQPRSATKTSDVRALQESEAKFRSLVENTAAPIGITNLTGDFTYVNKALADLTGYTIQKLVGRPFMEFLHPEDREEVLKVFMRGVSKSEEAPEIEFRVMRRDGQMLTLTSKPTRLEIDGKTAGFQAIITDITERKRTEEALRVSERKHRTLFETMAQGVVYQDSNGRITSANPAAERILGLTLDQMQGRTSTDPRWKAIHEDGSGFPGETHPSMVALETGKEVRNVVMGVFNPNSEEYRWININAVPQFKPGETKPFQAYTTFDDITERKRMEEEIRNLARFPSENPNPVLRLNKDSIILVANPASKLLLQEWGSEVGQVAPKFWRDLAADALSTRQDRNVDVEFGGRSYTFLVKPITDVDCVNLYGRDITERKKAEETLRLTQFALDHAGDEVVLIGPDARLVYVNEKVCQSLGYSRSELLSMTVYDLDPNFPKAAWPAHWKEVKERGSFTFESIHRTRDGREYPVEVAVNYLGFGSGELNCSVARDITERKRMQDELQRYSAHLEELVSERTGKLAESERRFRELSDLLPQIVFEIDENGNVEYMNRAAFAATGLSEEDYRRGLNASDMLASAEHTRAVRGMRRIMGGEMIGEREFNVLRRDGTAFPVIVYTAPIVREDKTVGLRGIAVDITERKRAQEELRAAKERLEYVITSNPAVIFSAKPRADYSDYNIAYLSDRVVEMLGFEPRQFIGHPEFWDGRVHPDDLRRYPMEVPELWKKGQRTFEYRFLHKDGSYRWIREEAKVIRDAAGKPVEVMGYWTDVTERKRMEAHLADVRRLAVIGETTAMVGHDLRNPLQAIVSTLYLAKRELTSPLESSREAAVKPGLVDMLETIENEAEYMSKIVSDLQDYAAPLKAEPKPVQMESLVRDTLLKIRIPQNVKVSFKVSEALQTVTVDPAVMRRVFSNLIMNAIQAMPNGGELTIDLSRTEEDLLVSFRDTGVGIPEENLGKLFNPFFTTKSKGQGLGLPVCKKLVEACDGRITVESKPGEGSTFTVKLPIIKP